MWTIGKSLQHGPSSISLAIINIACIFPPIFMAIVFGKEHGHEYSIQNALGVVFVIAGIFWMAGISSKFTASTRWIYFVSAAFLIHVLFLVFFQWRALLSQEHIPSLLLPFHCDASKGECFTLAMFLVAGGLQLLLLSSKKTNTDNASHLKDTLSPKKIHLALRFGFIGGAINGLGSFMLLRATEIATHPAEKAWLFPLYCVSLISFCNIWSRLFYQEKVHWAGNALCFCGIIIGVG